MINRYQSLLELALVTVIDYHQHQLDVKSRQSIFDGIVLGRIDIYLREEGQSILA